ncbi:hypothetical protein IWX75_003244 [Arthrobacter sp. CAN_A6]|uniref:hypothetical protein n=1 Tax=Arthrobacter sp. CAN_A6 TaxID=2787721 RepID=UPI0018C91789
MTPGENSFPEQGSEEAAAQAEVAIAAFKFLSAVYRGDLIQAWGYMHPILCLCWAQAWVEANRESLIASGHDPERTAHALASSAGGNHELWEHFARVMLHEMREAFPLDPDVAGIGANLRAVALDTELLYVHPLPPTSGVWEPDEFLEAYPLVMNLNDDRWTVLNWGYDAIPIPGFPPILDGASLGND